MLPRVPKIFYLGSGSHARGMLRAVVPPNQLESLLEPEVVKPIGDDFPEAYAVAITLIEIAHDEATAMWTAGLWRVEVSPTDFEERLRLLPERSSN